MIHKKNNLQADILDFLWANGSSDRQEICEDLEIPWTTIYDNLEKLRKRRLVENFKIYTGNRGRPRTYWRLKGE